ncbi:alpha-L-rhamnosidase domain protein [Fimbriimonas ginsengisoli Gsoil 348]|uniref:Alpha-L-rhamnosidase domain protein n=1 Tax=Fimbriimonas ginsengisoli Gsoil 348 TaxID=661478 RepID=A0A068NXZ4_FIMGI|nr:alpha-L-rhamnosidase domain protein [Fimbriimonas ginsengisoli Gsoil 348]
MAAGLFSLAAFASASPGQVLRTQANVAVEVAFTSQRHHVNSFVEVVLDVEFTDSTGKTKKVPAFWAGGEIWKVRFASPTLGKQSYRSICSDHADKGLDGVTGTVEIEPYQGANPLYKHGQLRIAADHRHFEHVDGTSFFWLADTWWKALSKRLTWEGFQELTADRVGKGFSAVQIVCGPYPDELPFQPLWENEGGLPYKTKEFSAVNPSYFDYADRRFAHLVDSGIVPVIVGGWGRGDCDAMRMVGIEGIKRHWRYLIARYWAYPTVWITGGEAQGPEWTKVALMIRATDPCDRPISIHPQQSGRLSVTDEGAVNFDMLQTGHGDMAAGMAAIPQLKAAVARQPAMPALIGEFCYEGHMQSAYQDVERYVFWASMLSGAAGLTYGAAGVWHASVDGDPGVQSAPGVNRVYDLTTWKEGMAYPGSTQIGLGKRLLETLPWSRFEPHPEWAEADSFAAGVPGEARVVYQPRRGVYNWTGTIVKGLEADVPYHAFYFDPVRGKQFDAGDFMRVDPEHTPVFRHSSAVLADDPLDGWQDAGTATRRVDGKLIGQKGMLTILPKIDVADATASVEARSDAEAGLMLRYHDKDNYVVALYSPLLHAIYIHDRRSGDYGEMLGKVEVRDLGPRITLTATVCGDNAIMELRDGVRKVATQSVRIANRSKGSAGLWMYQVGDHQEYSNYRLSDATGKLTRPVIVFSEFRAPGLPSPQDWVLVLRRIR